MKDYSRCKSQPMTNMKRTVYEKYAPVLIESRGRIHFWSRGGHPFLCVPYCTYHSKLNTLNITTVEIFLLLFILAKLENTKLYMHENLQLDKVNIFTPAQQNGFSHFQGFCVRTAHPNQ